MRIATVLVEYSKCTKTSFVALMNAEHPNLELVGIIIAVLNLEETT
jgi:hypothetical protein